MGKLRVEKGQCPAESEECLCVKYHWPGRRDNSLH